MVCIKFLAVALGLALGAQTADNALDAKIPSDQVAMWKYAWPKVQAQIPGIECSLGGPHIELNATAKKHESCGVIESKLLPIFPGIHCTGQLDKEALLKTLDAPVTAVRVDTLKRRATPLDAAVDRDIATRNKQLDQQKRSFLQGCAGAPHPGNCYTCVAGAAGQAIGNGSKCVVAAHIALKATNANQGQAWAAYAACVAGIAGDMGAAASGCSLRVSDNFCASFSLIKTNRRVF